MESLQMGRWMQHHDDSPAGLWSAELTIRDFESIHFVFSAFNEDKSEIFHLVKLVSFWLFIIRFLSS